MTATQKQIAAIHLYRDLMEEIKLRLNWMHLMMSRQKVLPEPAIREFCFLQLRMTCELIALGCLVAHGDIQATSRLRKEYSADKIMNDLERLHPDFYPRPMKQFLCDPKASPKKYFLLPLPNSFPKPELLQLYGKCGDVLHRGNLTKLTSTNTRKNLPDIMTTGKRIVELLVYHAILLFDSKAIICGMNSSDINPGKAHVSIAEPQVMANPKPGNAPSR
jgi:hypothetical protein